jgi:hypothetical protein
MSHPLMRHLFNIEQDALMEDFMPASTSRLMDLSKLQLPVLDKIHTYCDYQPASSLDWSDVSVRYFLLFINSLLRVN